MRVSEQVLLSVLRQGGRSVPGRTVADPDGAAESGLLTCHDCGHDAGGRTAEPSQRGLVSFIQCVVRPRPSGRGGCQTGLKLKPEMTPGEKP